jgi:hypothetical protein
MIISLALLGYGASGTFLVLLRKPLMANIARSYLANLLLFSVASLGCFLLAQRVGFNPEEILWSPAQWFRLLAVYLLLSLPFFFAANAIALMLMHYSARSGVVYGADLAGAGVGSMAVVLVLFVVFPLSAMQWISATGLLAAWLGCRELKVPVRRGITAGALASVAVLIALAQTSGLQISPYKGLSQTLRIPGSQIIAERSSPLGLISVLESGQVPLRHAPGLSLAAGVEPPPQLGIFTDADGLSVINKGGVQAPGAAYLDQVSSALAYHLREPGRVLILGAGGGSQVLQAQLHNATRIDAVELNHQVTDLVRDDYADFAGHLYDAPGVHVHNTEARGFLTRAAGAYDIIQLDTFDAFAASGAGLYSLSEGYLYTVEALRIYLRHLAPGGVLSITRWIRMPPRDSLKLFATAVAALRAEGIDDPAQHLVLIRSWQTSTLLVRNGRFTGDEIDAVQRFCRERWFDTAWFPGITAARTNRYNILDQPIFHTAATALLGNDGSDFMASYKYNIEPASDDRPYFFHFFKWSSLREVMELRGRGGTALLDTGYLVLLATLVQSAIVGLVLIIVPLWALHARSPTPGAARGRVLAYFTALGLGFLFIEIAFIQKFILFLNHPLYAAAVVLAAFLLFAGGGSAVSGARLFRRRAGCGLCGPGLPFAMIALLSVAYLAGLDAVFERLAATGDGVRIAVSVALIAPLAFFMGMPFALGLRALGERAPQQVPWAWGINGCASVVSAVLATVIAMQTGFTVVVLIAVLLYIAAAFAFPDRPHHGTA